MVTDRQRQIAEAVAQHGSHRRAAEALGVGHSTVDKAMARIRKDDPAWAERSESRIDRGDFTAPAPPKHLGETPAERWARRRQRFQNAKAATDAREWMQFRLKRVEPCAVLWFGDPHLDDDGCDFDALEAAIRIGNLPGVYSVGIGDYTNNWVGRLARLYAHQEGTAATAWADARYFIRDRGLQWLTLIKGNHDLWAGAGDPIDYIAEGTADVATWRARFTLAWSNGAELRIDAAHDFKGHSQYSASFGPKKEAYFDGRAQIYVCGHKHSASLDRFNHPFRGTKHEAFRVAGFKRMDQHALVNGFSDATHGEAMLTVIDPRTVYLDGAPKFRTFDCVEDGAAYLQSLQA